LVTSGLLFFSSFNGVFSRKVTGTIADGQGSLPGANVTGTKTGVSADFDGNY
jgi:hypothetical protein